VSDDRRAFVNPPFFNPCTGVSPVRRTKLVAPSQDLSLAAAVSLVGRHVADGAVPMLIVVPVDEANHPDTGGRNKVLPFSQEGQSGCIESTHQLLGPLTVMGTVPMVIPDASAAPSKAYFALD